MTAPLFTDPDKRSPAPQHGPPVLDWEIPLSAESLALIQRGIAALWARIVASDPDALRQSLLLSYDVHPTPQGPVLIEINTNAGGVLSAMQAARRVNECCPDAEQAFSRERLLSLFRRDLLGPTAAAGGHVAIVDDNLADQPLRGEMERLAELFQDEQHEVCVIDAAELDYIDGRLRHGARPIDRVYWRSTDFQLQDAAHAPVREALADGVISLAPSPQAYRAIAAKSRFLDWSREPRLAVGEDGLEFHIARTERLDARPLDAWYAQRRDWVFKPMEGHGSRGVYVGKRISRTRLAALQPEIYLAQRYAPHPTLMHNGEAWKYDLRFYADRDVIIGAAARVFQGQVVGLSVPGSGFAPVRIGGACCIQGALANSRQAG